MPSIDTPFNVLFPFSRGRISCGKCVILRSYPLQPDRTYHCSVCGHIQDNDLNAAKKTLNDFTPIARELRISM